MRTRWMGALAVASAVVITTGCAAGADRTGSSTLTLKVATIDGEADPAGQLVGVAAFLDALEAESGGAIEVNLETSYGDGDPEAEAELVQAVADGSVDLAWPATRAFAAAGVEGLRSVEAPMQLTSYEAQRALIEGTAPDLVAERLDDAGLTSLGMLIGPLRRPFAAEGPLITPAAWQEVRFRVFNSPTQEHTVEALGGDAVAAGSDWADRLRAGELDGAEFDVRQYWSNGLTTEAPWVAADVVLWPKVLVLLMNRERLASLPEEQRGWIEQAAEVAVAASVAGDYDETEAAGELCATGVRFVPGDDGATDALREQLAPVLEELASDPAESPLLDEVLAIAERHPEPYLPDLPDGCDDPNAPAADPRQAGAATLPDGRYRVEVTKDDVVAAKVSTSQGYPGTWTMDVLGGTYAFRCQVLSDPGRDCGQSDMPPEHVLEAGRLVTNGEGVVTFVYDEEVHGAYVNCPEECFPVPDSTAAWRLDGDALVFSAVEGTTVANGLMVIEPWTRIGDAEPPR